MMETLEHQLDRLIGGDDDLPLAASSQTRSATGAIGMPLGNTVGRSSGQEDAASSFLSSLVGGNSSGNQQPMAVPIMQQQRPDQSPRGFMQPSSKPSNFSTQPPPSPAQPTPSNQNGGSLHTSPSPVPSTPRSPVRSPIQQSQQAQQVRGQLTKTPRKESTQQKRLWTHTDEQPGRIFVNNDMNTSSPHVVLDIRPRQEIGAKWMVSWQYLQQRAEELAKKKFDDAESDGDLDSHLKQPQLEPRDDNPLNRLLPNLRLGLFRRGCAENGAQASIISKEVMISGRGRPPYLDAKIQMVIGSVPFYSPRTPGHVVFRLYWDDDPLYTLAVGPTLHVRVTEEDYDGTIRFLLSNLKKKVNPTSLSSLHSLALALETPLPMAQQQSRGRQQHQQQQANDRAGRATWGCICEARKVLDACAVEYAKTSQRLAKLTTVVEDLKAEEEARKKEEEAADEERTTATDDDIDRFDDIEYADGENNNVHDGKKEDDEQRTQTLREKTRALMSGRASCERKWRDSQLAFASILKVRFLFGRIPVSLSIVGDCSLTIFARPFLES